MTGEPRDDYAPYLVVSFGPHRWFVVHFPTKTVTCECRDQYAARGIALLAADAQNRSEAAR